MILVNETPLAAELGLGTVGADKPVAYVVVKATCTIPRRGVAALAQENLPVLFADEPCETPRACGGGPHAPEPRGYQEADHRMEFATGPGLFRVLPSVRRTAPQLPWDHG